MTLITANRAVLRQLVEVIGQLPDEAYGRFLAVLSGNSIGKHIRHILEFYNVVINSVYYGNVNYDHRPRNFQLETDTHEAVRRINALDQAIQQIDLNQPLQLQAVLSVAGEDLVQIQSSFARELLYNLDHAIHHMALIRIAVQINFPSVTLPPHFGVAYATVQYQLSDKPCQPHVNSL